MIYTYNKNEYDNIVLKIEDELFDSIIDEYPQLSYDIDEYTNNEIDRDELLKRIEDALSDYAICDYPEADNEDKQTNDIFIDDVNYIYDENYVTNLQLPSWSDGTDENLKINFDLYDIRNRCITGEDNAVNVLFDNENSQLKSHALKSLLNNAKFTYKSVGKNIITKKTNKSFNLSDNNVNPGNCFRWPKSVVTSIPEEETESTFFFVLSLLLQGKDFIVLNNGEIDFDFNNAKKFKNSTKAEYKKGTREYELFLKYKKSIIFPQYKLTNESGIYQQLVYATIKILNQKYKDEDIKENRRPTIGALKKRILIITAELEKHGVFINSDGSINDDIYCRFEQKNKKVVEDLIITWKKINNVIEGSDNSKDSNGNYINKNYVEGYIPPRNVCITKEIEDETKFYEGDGGDESYSVSKTDKNEYEKFIKQEFRKSKDNGFQFPYNQWHDILAKTDFETLPYFTSDEQRAYVDFIKNKHKIHDRVISDEYFTNLYFTNNKGYYKPNYEAIGDYFGVKKDAVMNIFRQIRKAFKIHFDEYGIDRFENKISFTYKLQYLWGLYIYLAGEGQRDTNNAEEYVDGKCKINLAKLKLFTKYVWRFDEALIDIFEDYYDEVEPKTDSKGNLMDKNAVRTWFRDAIKKKNVLIYPYEAYCMFMDISSCIHLFLYKNIFTMYWDDNEKYKDYAFYESGQFKVYLNNTSEKIKDGFGYDYKEKRQYKSFVRLWEIKCEDDNPQTVNFYRIKHNTFGRHMSQFYDQDLVFSLSDKNKECIPLGKKENLEIKYSLMNSERSFCLIDNENKNIFHLFYTDRGFYKSHERKIFVCIKNLFDF